MKIYLVGIKGSGMSALACILKDLGHDVNGSDISEFVFTESKLIEKNIVVTDFEIENIDNTIDVIIVGNAFSDTHEQVIYAKSMNLKIIRYYDFINEFFSDNKMIAIAGTNGKTTTTSMVNTMLSSEKIISLIGDGNGFGQQNSDLFILEACEYKNTFWNYNPNVAVINNIEMDHPDFFRDINDVLNTYQKFANLAEVLIINGDDNNCRLITHENKYTFGLNQENFLYLKNIKTNTKGFSFNLIIDNNDFGYYELPFVGDHMIYNSMASILVGYLQDIDIKEIISNLALFTGARRRFEITEVSNTNLYVIDDYAHHPTAIELTINAIRQKFPNCELTVIFQPHTFSRTIEFLDEFAETLNASDYLYLAEIFGSARESQSDVNIDILKDKVKSLNGEILDNLDHLKGIKSNHVVAILGAGNVDVLYKNKVVEFLGE